MFELHIGVGVGRYASRYSSLLTSSNTMKNASTEVSRGDSRIRVCHMAENIRANHGSVPFGFSNNRDPCCSAATAVIGGLEGQRPLDSRPPKLVAAGSQQQLNTLFTSCINTLPPAASRPSA